MHTEHDQVRGIVTEMAIALDRGERPSGPMEARLATACRRAVWVDLCTLCVSAAGAALRWLAEVFGITSRSRK